MKQSEPSKSGPRRRAALRLLLLPAQLKESLVLTMQPSIGLSFLAGLQAATTALIALPLFALSPWSYLLGLAVLGAPVALFGRFAPAGTRTTLLVRCAIVQVLTVLFMSIVCWLIDPGIVTLAILAAFSGLLFYVSVSARLGLPGPLIFVLAASASMGKVDSWRMILEHVAATAIVAGLALAICHLSETLRVRLEEGMSTPTALQPLGHRIAAGMRVAVGATVAMFCAHGLHATHPGWAAVGLVAVMQGQHLHLSMNRAVQRTIGTACGTLIAWPVLAFEPSIGAIIVVLAIFMVLTEVIIGWNYALGQLSVTPMALLMSQLPAAHALTVSIVPERILDTLLGALVAIMIAVLTSTLDDRIRLANRRSSLDHEKTNP